VLRIGGPRNVSPHEVTRIFESAFGRSFALEHVPEQQLLERYEAATDPMVKSYAALMLEYARGCPMDMAETITVLPRSLTTVEQYALAARRAS
jgi:hypothetical protein